MFALKIIRSVCMSLAKLTQEDGWRRNKPKINNYIEKRRINIKDILAEELELYIRND